jgi:hypothetical protein
VPSKRPGQRQADSSNKRRTADVRFADRFGQRQLTGDDAASRSWPVLVIRMRRVGAGTVPVADVYDDATAHSKSLAWPHIQDSTRACSEAFCKTGDLTLRLRMNKGFRVGSASNRLA